MLLLACLAAVHIWLVAWSGGQRELELVRIVPIEDAPVLHWREVRERRGLVEPIYRLENLSDARLAVAFSHGNCQRITVEIGGRDAGPDEVFHVDRGESALLKMTVRLVPWPGEQTFVAWFKVLTPSGKRAYVPARYSIRVFNDSTAHPATESAAVMQADRLIR